MKPARGGLSPAGLGLSIAVLLTLVGGAIAGSFYLGTPAPDAAPAGLAPSEDAAAPRAADAPPSDASPLQATTLAHRVRDGAREITYAGDAPPQDDEDEPAAPQDEDDGSSQPDVPPSPPLPGGGGGDGSLTEPVEDAVDDPSGRVLDLQPSVPPLGTSVLGLR